MTTAPKLELTWPGKHDAHAIIRDDATGRPRRIPHADIHPRLLIEQSRHGDCTTSADNLLIQGENLFALTTLLASGYAGKVKLIYIDPPFNTGNTFTHYDDGIEHSLWLTMMRDRLRLLRTLLAPNGSIWVQLDDNEAHYCRVLMDEIFGRDCFIADITWKKRDGPPNDRRIGAIHDRILVYGRARSLSAKATVAELSFNLMPRTDKANMQYRVWTEPDGSDPRGPFRQIDMAANAKGGRHVDHLVFPIRNPYTGEDVWPRKGTNWRHNPEEIARLTAERRIYWGAAGTRRTPMRKYYLSEAKEGMSAPSLWDDVGLNQHAAAELEALFGDKAAFETPKPEALLRRIVWMGSNRQDIVLDCFSGSGTTAAVAHKMNRRWVAIEADERACQLASTRLQQVVAGTDQGGISKLVPPHPSKTHSQPDLFGDTQPELGWTGGGGFRFYTLGQALLDRDADLGVWRLNYTNGPLIEAVCLHEGFRLCANGHRHGIKGRHYAHVTDHFVTQPLLDTLATELNDDERLTVYCLKTAPNLTPPAGIDIRRIPHALVEAQPR